MTDRVRRGRAGREAAVRSGRDGAQPSWETDEPGTYLLLLRLAEPTALRIGRLGAVALPAGWYVYVGSALGGLGARLRRHARRGKPTHWHVDALREVADLTAIAFRIGPERLECATAARLGLFPGAGGPAPGFGSTDCRCRTHLYRFAEEPNLALDAAWIVVPVRAAGGRSA